MSLMFRTENRPLSYNIIKASAWKRKNPAYARNGKVYISSDIDAVTLGTAVPHEATHVMLQQGFSQYQKFVDSTADFLQIKSDAAFDLMYLIAEHCGIDVFDMSAAEQKLFYSELNATVYGMYQGGILDDPRYDYGTWIPGAFKDFDGYIREMDAIHAQFKERSDTADPSAGGLSKLWSPGTQPTNREALAWVLENKELQRIDPRTRTVLQEYGRHLQQLQQIRQMQSQLQPTGTDASTSQLAQRNFTKLEGLYARHEQRLTDLEKNPRLQRLAQQTLTDLAPSESETVKPGQNTDVDITRTYDRINGDAELRNNDQETEKLDRAKRMQENAKMGAASEDRLLAKFCAHWVGTKRQITIKTSVGKVRVDAIGCVENDDGSYTVVIAEFKASKTARLTKNQRTVFPEIAKNGGVVTGKGKDGFGGGSVIPPGTTIQVVRELGGGDWYVSDRFG